MKQLVHFCYEGEFKNKTRKAKKVKYVDVASPLRKPTSVMKVRAPTAVMLNTAQDASAQLHRISLQDISSLFYPDKLMDMTRSSLPPSFPGCLTAFSKVKGKRATQHIQKPEPTYTHFISRLDRVCSPQLTLFGYCPAELSAYCPTGSEPLLMQGQAHWRRRDASRESGRVLGRALIYCTWENQDPISPPFYLIQDKRENSLKIISISKRFSSSFLVFLFLVLILINKTSPGLGGGSNYTKSCVDTVL